MQVHPSAAKAIILNVHMCNKKSNRLGCFFRVKQMTKFYNCAIIPKLMLKGILVSILQELLTRHTSLSIKLTMFDIRLTFDWGDILLIDL
jgi:hypothetical protein